MLQHQGSSAQTQSSIQAVSQPGVPLGAQQSPVPPQGPQSSGQDVQSSSRSHQSSPQKDSPPQLPQPNWVTSSTQVWSQTLLQHQVSCAQTQASIPASSQPGVPLASQQSPPPPQGPQSSGQEAQSSSKSHQPLPQSSGQGPQSSGQSSQSSGLSQEPSPQIGPVPQKPQPYSSTSATQVSSHSVSQQ